MNLSLFPALELEASDVSLSNPPDARSPDMVNLKQLQMRLRILPLLHGSIVVSRLLLLRRRSRSRWTGQGVRTGNSERKQRPLLHRRA